MTKGKVHRHTHTSSNKKLLAAAQTHKLSIWDSVYDVHECCSVHKEDK